MSALQQVEDAQVDGIVELPPGPPAWRGWTREARIAYLTERVAWRESRFPWRRRAAADACRELIEFHEAAIAGPRPKGAA